MELVRCTLCHAGLAGVLGNVVVITNRDDRVEIVGATEVRRKCRGCGKTNQVYPLEVRSTPEEVVSLARHLTE